MQELETAKKSLENHFCTHYCTTPSCPSTPPSSSSPASLSSVFDSPEKFDFTTHYETQVPVEHVDKWEEFLTLRHESFQHCDPIWCWAAHSSRFSRLSKLAHDILSIPGAQLLFPLTFCCCWLDIQGLTWSGWAQEVRDDKIERHLVPSSFNKDSPGRKYGC